MTDMYFFAVFFFTFKFVAKNDEDEDDNDGDDDNNNNDIQKKNYTHLLKYEQQLTSAREY